MKRLIAVDVGNTAWKFGLFDLPARLASKTDTYPYSLDDRRDVSPPFPNLSSWLETLSSLRGKENFLWSIAGVNRKKIDQILSWIHTSRPYDLVEEIRTEKVSMVNRYSNPSQLGIDRLLAGLAASHLFPNSFIMVVDVGTATKIDWIDSSSAFCGGAIFPGPEVAAHSLFDHTDRLPNVSLETGSFSWPATNTNDAIRSGIRGSLLGTILFFHQEAILHNPGVPLHIILTGGGAVNLQRDLELHLGHYKQTSVQTTRDLILTGIYLATVQKLSEETEKENR